MKYKIEAQDIIEQTPPSNDVKVPLFEQRPTLFCHRLHDLTAVLAVMRFGQKRIWTDGEAVLSARHACLSAWGWVAFTRYKKYHPFRQRSSNPYQ
jgi:hypothetical protein